MPGRVHDPSIVRPKGIGKQNGTLGRRLPPAGRDQMFSDRPPSTGTICPVIQADDAVRNSRLALQVGDRVSGGVDKDGNADVAPVPDQPLCPARFGEQAPHWRGDQRDE